MFIYTQRLDQVVATQNACGYHQEIELYKDRTLKISVSDTMTEKNYTLGVQKERDEFTCLPMGTESKQAGAGGVQKKKCWIVKHTTIYSVDGKHPKHTDPFFFNWTNSKTVSRIGHTEQSNSED